MGDAFLTRRGAKKQKITFNNTPMVATKTLSNIITARTQMGVCSNNEYFVAMGGQRKNGMLSNEVNIFDRGGKRWTNSWPIGLIDMAVTIDNHKLMAFGGMYGDNSCSTLAYKWPLGSLLRGDSDSGNCKRMQNLAVAKSAINIGKSHGQIELLGGATDNWGTNWQIESYNQFNDATTSQGHSVLSTSLPYNHVYAGCVNITECGIILSGGVDVNNQVLTGGTELIGRNSDGVVTRKTLNSLTDPQYAPAAAVIYNEGFSYALIGLGKTLNRKIVSSLDIYYYDGISEQQCNTVKYCSITLPLTGTPTSAIGLSFGNCALFIVGYGNGTTKNKGYFVKISPPNSVITSSIEFNFSRDGMQGGVIGNDVAFLCGGTKNGNVTGDVEMIKLMRDVPIYPGMKYKLGNMANEETASSFTLYPLWAVTQLSGYMKL